MPILLSKKADRFDQNSEKAAGARIRGVERVLDSLKPSKTTRRLHWKRLKDGRQSGSKDRDPGNRKRLHWEENPSIVTRTVKQQEGITGRAVWSNRNC